MYLARKRPDFSTSEAPEAAPPTWGEIWSSTLESMRLNRSTVAAGDALEDAYDQRIDGIVRAGGPRLSNPMRVPRTDAFLFEPRRQQRAVGLIDLDGAGERLHDQFMAELAKLQEQRPDLADVIQAGRPVQEDARQLARRAEEHAGEVWARSSGGALAWSASLAGGFAGSARDPAFLATFWMGPWSSVGTGARAILWNALKTGAVNATGEIASQPFIQRWRAEAGLSHGLGEAATDVGMAFALGFGLDAGVRGAWRGFRRVQGRVPVLDDQGRVAQWINPTSGGPEGHVPVLDPQGHTVAFKPRGLEAPNLTAEGPRGSPSPGAAPDPETAVHDAATRLPYENPVRRAAEGDLDAADEVARQLGIQDSPEYRGARQAAAIERDLDDVAPPFTNEDEVAAKRLQGLRAALDQDEPPPLHADPVPPARHQPITDHGPRPPARFTMDGKPVSFADVPAARIGTDAAQFQFKGGVDAQGVTQRLLGVEVWDPLAAGRAIVFERSDGAQIIADGHQRLALAKRLEATGQTPDGGPIELPSAIFREADGWRPEDVRAIAARKNLQEGSGTVLDAARVIRERPDIIDASVPLTTTMMSQARALARLSDQAFGMVLEGRVAPNHAAVVGELVEARGLHAAMIRSLEQAQPANVREARLIVSDLLQTPTTEVQRILLDGSAPRALLSERAGVLDAAIRLLKDDARIFQLVSREAGRLSEVGSRIAVDPSADRALRSELVSNVLQEAASRPGPLSDLLDDAARAVAGGANVKEVAEAFARDVREALERGGLAALMPERPAPLRARGIDEPGGAEAQAQVAELEAALQARLEAANRRSAARALRQHFDREAAAGREQPPLTPRQRELALDHIAKGEQVRTAIQKAKNEAVKAARAEAKADDDIAATMAKIRRDLQGDRERMLGDTTSMGRQNADALVASGESFEVDELAPGLIAAARTEMAPMLDLVEQLGLGGYEVGIASKVKVLTPGFKNPLVRVTFIKPDGGTFDRVDRWRAFQGFAFHDGGVADGAKKPTIGLTLFGGDFRPAPALSAEALDDLGSLGVGQLGHSGARLDVPAALGPRPLMFGEFVRSVLIHEMGHAIYSDLDEATRRLLVDHAIRLRVMEMPRGEFERLTSFEPHRLAAETANPDPLRVDYEQLFAAEVRGDDAAAIARRADLLNEEAVMHMLQLAYLGRFTPKQMAPIRSILEAVFDGRREHLTRAVDAEPGLRTSGQRNFMLVGEAGASRSGAGRDLLMLEAAQRMESAGRTEVEIERLTGWFRDDNGAWAREVPDRELRLRPEAAAALKGRQAGTSGAATALFSHPELYRRYPELAWLTVELQRKRSVADVAALREAGFAGEGGHVPGRTAFADLDNGRIRIVAATPTEAAQKFAVEMHRFIARAEGMAEGGTPSSAIAVAQKLSRSMEAEAASALERLQVLDEARHVDPLFGRMAERNEIAVELARLRAVKIELDKLSPIEAYNRLSGTVAGRAIAERLRLGERARARNPFSQAQDVPPERRIVSSRGPERQFGGDWEEDAWRELERRALAGERGEQGQTRGGQAGQPVDITKRMAKAIRDMERKLLDQGKTLGEVAAALEQRFGMPFDAAEIGKREVWWRLDDIARGRGRKPSWTEAHEAELTRLWEQGMAPEAIAERMSELRGIPTTANAVRVRASGLGLSADRGWKLEVTAEMLRLYRAGVPTPQIAERVSELRGIPTTAATVLNRVSSEGAAGGRKVPLLSWLTEEREASLVDMVRRGLTDAQILAELKRDPALADVPITAQSILGARQLFGLAKTGGRRPTLAPQPPRQGVPKPGSPWADPEVMRAFTSDDIAAMSVADAAAALSERFAPRTFTQPMVAGKRRAMEARPPLLEPGDAERDVADRIGMAGKVAKECKS